MPTKKQTKKTSTKIKRTMKPVTRSQKISSDAQLRTWLFDRPIVFAVLTFLINAVVGIVYAIFANIFSITATWPLALLLVASFCWTTYYLIKKLPHDSMYRDNFIAITNGCCLISILISSITMLLISKNTTMIQYKFLLLYMQYPELVWFLGALFILIYLYLLGVTISGIYAKYKRAVEIGISKWKVILSMPFAFLLIWTPG